MGCAPGAAAARPAHVGQPRIVERATVTGSPHRLPEAAARADEVVARAGALCRDRGVRLTETRAKVLDVLARGTQPVGAYEIVDALAEDGPRPAPVTVYRALDFLVGQGLAHRIESRNAFVACSHVACSHAEPAAQEHGTSVFLICRRCGAVTEVAGDALDRSGCRCMPAS